LKSVPYLCLALSAFLTAVPAARADELQLELDDEIEEAIAKQPRVLQWSIRLGGGLGSRRVEESRKLIMDTNLRADWLWGQPSDRSIRVGPAVEVRTANFSTLEGAAGATLLLPMHPGWPLQLSSLFGYAGRFGNYGDSAAVFVGTAAFGYRSYNYHSRYGVGINLYATTRVDLHGTGSLEVVGGIEFDLQLGLLIPALMIKMAANKGDPDEPEDEEGDYYEGF
jgi:hypothetical protein